MLENALKYIYFLEIIGFFAIGLLTLLRQRSKLHKSFFLFATLLGIWQLLQALSLVVAGTPSIATLLLTVSVAFSPLMTVSLFIFTKTYRHEQGPYWLFLPAALVGSIAFLSDGLREVEIATTGIGIPRLDVYYACVLVFDLGLLVASIYNFVHFYRKTRSKMEKSQTRIMLWSIALAGVIIAMSSFYTTDFSNTLLAQQVIPFVCLLTLLSFMFAMTYRDLFDIHIFVLRAGAYLSTYFIITLLVTTPVIFLISKLLALDMSLAEISAYSLIIVIFAYLLQYLRTQLDKVTSGIFFRKLYDAQAFLDEHNNVLVANNELNPLLNNSAGVIAYYLQTQMCVFWLHSTEYMPQRFIGDKAPKIPKKQMAELAKLKPLVEGQILLVDELDSEYTHLREAFIKQGVSLIIRLATPYGDELGFMMLGPKKSGETYAKRDTKILQIISNELVIAIQNALRFEQIQEFSNTLQQRINDATKELRATNKQLQHLDEIKDEFVSMASHQLRTPLTSVKGYISMVLEGDAGRITAVQRQLLEEAFTSSERMVHLIGDFLNVSRLQTGKFMIDQRPIDLAKVIGQEVESLQTTAKAHDLRLEYHAPSYFPTLYIDEGKIRQVVMNFIDNAIYYSREDSAITVELSVIDGNGVLQVHDTGIGVPKSEQAHLFSKFFRATNARKQRPDGTGVGLYLAKKVVVAHGGTVLFESVEGVGSTFGFRLPIKKLSDAPANDADQLK
jgi:signal transduction histidine kinase